MLRLKTCHLGLKRYQFKGWMIVTEGVKKLNDDYFIMPSKDVTLRAEWGKMGLSKSVKGEVYVQKDPILKRVGFDSYNKELWQYKDSITRIVIEGDQTSKEGSKYEWDISEAKDESVRGVLVPNSDNPSTYTAYIQGSEGEVIANPDSSYLFYSFTKLTTIEGLGLLNTSQVTNMGDMFSDCQSLTSLDLSSWDTSHVTNMSSMFSDCKALTSLEGLNGWNTGQVTRMNSMFYSCNALSNLDLSSWTTSQVTGMSYMFYNCDALSNLDLSSWNTGQVTNMGYMFYGCNLITLNLSGWDTSQVTNMGYMFYNCHELVNVGNLSGWNTGQVKDIDRMFYGCQSLTSLDLSNWNTSQVTSMDYLFYHCYDLASVGNLSGWNTSQVTDMQLGYAPSHSYELHVFWL